MNTMRTSGTNVHPCDVTWCLTCADSYSWPFFSRLRKLMKNEEAVVNYRWTCWHWNAYQRWDCFAQLRVFLCQHKDTIINSTAIFWSSRDLPHQARLRAPTHFIDVTGVISKQITCKWNLGHQQCAPEHDSPGSRGFSPLADWITAVR